MHPSSSSTQHTVRFQTSDGITAGDLRYGEGDESAGEAECWLQIDVGGRRFESSGDDFFECLLTLRRELEQNKLQICVNGASIDVWPSPMSRSMGGGLRAYRLSLGKPALMQDLVDIFALDPVARPSSVADQMQYYDAWLRSLDRA